MTPLYPAGVYAPLPRFSKKTQTNIAPSVTRNTANARCSRDAPIISVAWSSKGSLPLPCFGEPSRRYSPPHAHSGSFASLSDNAGNGAFRTKKTKQLLSADVPRRESIRDHLLQKPSMQIPSRQSFDDSNGARLAGGGGERGAGPKVSGGSGAGSLESQPAAFTSN